MERHSPADPSALPGVGVLVLCAAVLFSGYVFAALLPVDVPAVAAEEAAGQLR
jgi:hypothetical protein